jgi:hypothetical protein
MNIKNIFRFSPLPGLVLSGALKIFAVSSGMAELHIYLKTTPF